MKVENGELLYSASDLAHHLYCDYLTGLNRQFAYGDLQKEHYQDPFLELLIELGERHEVAYLDFLKAEGKSVVEIEEFGGDISIEKTQEAMRDGVDIITQAAMVSLPWRGRADFLIRVNTPSSLGGWSYEVADTKLSKTTRAATVLQLCLYSEILEDYQGLTPEMMYVVRPGDPFEVEPLRVLDYMAYYRMAKSDFLSFLDNGFASDNYPEPNPHCQVCDWWKICNGTWREDDHLKFVAGLGKAQIHELKQHDITTLQSFGSQQLPLTISPQRGSIQTFEKLHKQAKIQLEGREANEPKFEFVEIEDRRGFLRLPDPSKGDIFFDIEGYPRAIGESLEYLLGYVSVDEDQPTYHQIWGLNKKEEKQAFAKFMQIVMDRWRQWPDMHVYHFAPYEPSALKRLATRHAIFESELDQLLRAERFVDLYAVTRQAVRASVESYSIKELEKFYGFQREEALQEASRSLRSIERLIELNLTNELGVEQKNIIERYNQDDCFSTLALRNWLESLRIELIDSGVNLPRPLAEDGSASEEVSQMEAEAKEVFDKLVEGIPEETVGEEQSARWLLAHMLEYFRREDKCAWWEYFRLADLEYEESIKERKAIAGLVFDQAVPSTTGRLPTHRYTFLPQETTIDVGDSVEEILGEKVGRVVDIDYNNSTIDIKKRRDSVELHPASIFTFDFVSSGNMPASLLQFGRQITDGNTRSGRYDLLARRSPRLKTLSMPIAGDQKEAAIKLALDLDESCLPIQGPPGAGKTHVGSHMILELGKRGKRVGVTAVSHRVISNLLNAVVENSDASSSVNVGQQKSDGDELPEGVRHLSNRDESLSALDEGCVVGGTAWLWSHEALEEQLDYLFIDEAGQMSLAMALAAGRSAKNIVLLGDPQQLEQPQQGTHPEGAGVAALDHVLNGESTIPETDGLFLKQTWRLHPDICEFTSEQYYDCRLESKTDLDRQRIDGNSEFTGHGLRFVPVCHETNQNRSVEEVEVISQLFGQLMDGSHSWTNMKNETIALGVEDILIVAPYNAQVSAIKQILPDGARVGTVDKFQGQEAPIVIYSMTSSSVLDAPRGMNFLFSRNRMNVATSRARCLAILVGSPKLFTPDCDSPEQIRLANGFCRYLEMAPTIDLSS